MALYCSSLASGSSGNAFLVKTDTTKVLIDAGLSLKKLRGLADALDESLDSLDGIIVTHEHGDHIKGVGICARKIGCPIIATQGTCEKMQKKLNGSEKVQIILNNQNFFIGDIHFKSFATLHDAADPIGLLAEHDGRRLGFATDLGMMSTQVREHLKGNHLLVLESNHDEKMLMENTKYTLSLKQRIKSNRGHLSNHTARVMLSMFLEKSLHTVMFAHLSSENNDHLKVEKLMSTLLEEKDAQDTRLIILQQDSPSGFVLV